SILVDSHVTPTKHGRMPKPYSSPCFIANCFNVGYLKMEVKVTPTKHGRMPKPYSSPCFIANCFNVGYLKMEVKVKDIKEKDKIRAKTRQNQEQTGSVEKTKVKPDKVKY
nr:hypothetical protein [Tanacetum cinerariifolium]